MNDDRMNTMLGRRKLAHAMFNPIKEFVYLITEKPLHPSFEDTIFFELTQDFIQPKACYGCLYRFSDIELIKHKIQDKALTRIATKKFIYLPGDDADQVVFTDWEFNE